MLFRSGSLTGSILAAIAMFLLNYLIKNVIDVSMAPAFIQNIFTYTMLVYALVLIIIIMFRPKGFLGSREFSLINIYEYFKIKFNTPKAPKQPKEPNIILKEVENHE